MSRPLVAILRGIRPDDAVSAGEVLVEAGITMIEVPLNSPQPFESIRRLADSCGPHVTIGAGTVLSADDVDRVSEAGGRLIVSPDCNDDVIQRTKALGMLSYPGVFTPSECFRALRQGADVLKFFPGSLMGPEGLKAIRVVLPESAQVYAVGGAGAGNFREWIMAGAAGFGLGSALYRAGDTMETLNANARDIVTAFDEAHRDGLAALTGS